MHIFQRRTKPLRASKLNFWTSYKLLSGRSLLRRDSDVQERYILLCIYLLSTKVLEEVGQCCITNSKNIHFVYSSCDHDDEQIHLKTLVLFCPIFVWSKVKSTIWCHKLQWNYIIRHQKVHYKASCDQSLEPDQNK